MDRYVINAPNEQIIKKNVDFSQSSPLTKTNSQSLPYNKAVNLSPQTHFLIFTADVSFSVSKH